jgi:methionyl-tRNA synthetase
MNKAFISTSIPYVNGDPHIGFALEAVQCDTLARWYRQQGYETFFSSGTDENAIKNVESAEKLGMKTQELVDKNSAEFLSLKEKLDLSFTDFIRTSSPRHHKGSQKLWKLCEKDIYKKTYTGLYCVGCETFYQDGEFENNICPNHNRKLETVSEENYFFALSRYEDKLREIISSGKIKLYPENKKTEILNFINKGLQDFSISRPTERTKNWGIPVPGDDSQRIYVWFDALVNYITILDFDTNGELYHKFWVENENRIHVIGKDIIKFHAIYWPAMLLSANLPIPTTIYVHGFITSEGKKMSKTLGNVIDPFKMVDDYGVDAVRYYLLKEIPALDDGDFSTNRMNDLNNSDLANELGNLVVRITTLAEKDGITLENTQAMAGDAATRELFLSFQFNIILEKIWEKIKAVNKDINDKAPWKLVGKEKTDFLIENLKKIRQFGFELQAFMPSTAEKILFATQGQIKKIPPLFPKHS